MLQSVLELSCRKLNLSETNQDDESLIRFVMAKMQAESEPKEQ